MNKTKPDIDYTQFVEAEPPDEQQPRKPDAWERIARRIDPSHGVSSDELVLREGDSAEVIFLGEPWAYEAAWHDERKQWLPVRRSPVPVEPALRVRINVYVLATKSVKWWEMDASTFRTLAALREEWGLTDWLFVIKAADVSRYGSCRRYGIYPDCKLTHDMRARVSSLPLFGWVDEEPGDNDEGEDQ